MTRLNRKFYERDTLKVARALLGKKLVRQIKGGELSGIIVETEAYCGEADTACHAHRGKTPRNTIMFGEPGQPRGIREMRRHVLGVAVEVNDGPARSSRRRKKHSRQLRPVARLEFYNFILNSGRGRIIEDILGGLEKQMRAAGQRGCRCQRKSSFKFHN